MAAYSNNPFTPTFGHVPFALAGRSDYIDEVIGGLANRPGDPNRSTIFVGPRGSGKSVLLTSIARIAAEQGWVSVHLSAREGMLEEAIWELQSNAGHLLPAEPSSDITAVKAGPVGVTREMRRFTKTWRTQMGEAIDALNEQGVGLLFTVDEVDPDCDELKTLVDAYQHFMSDDKDVALLLAGLPSRVSDLLIDEHISFIRRAFQRPLNSIPQIEVEQALLKTIEENGRAIDSEALAFAAESTHGFAFAIQLVGYYLWRQGSLEQPLNVEDVQKAIGFASGEMERSVFAPTLRELRIRELQYLYAMAQDEGPSSTSEVAKRMGIGMSNASNLRRRLIDFGVISEVRMGVVQFEMPMLREYMRNHSEFACG